MEAGRNSWCPLKLERKVSLAHIHSDMFGTLDIRIIEHYGRLFIKDYKHGAGVPVNVQDEDKGVFGHNTQLVYYALASAHEYGWDFQDVSLGILQPRAPHHLGPSREVIMDIKTLKAYEDLFRKAVDRVYAPNAKRFAGDWCRWCVAKEDLVVKGKVVQKACTEYKRIANSRAAKEFAAFV